MNNLFMFHVKPVGISMDIAFDNFKMDTIKEVNCAVSSTVKSLPFIKVGFAYYNRMTFFGETPTICPQEIHNKVGKLFSVLTVELYKNTRNHSLVEFFESPIPVQYIKSDQLGDYLETAKKLTDKQCDIAWDKIVKNEGNAPTLPGMEDTLTHWKTVLGCPIVTIRGLKPANMPKGFTVYAVN